MKKRTLEMETAWEHALSKLTYGIYVLTTFQGSRVNGMIASWVSQVSYDPPLVMVAVHQNRYSHHLLTETGCFALHILSRNQTDLLKRFKGPDPEAKFESIQWVKGKLGCPIIDPCIAYMECEVRTTYRPGNHTLFVGEIRDARVLLDEEPLNTMDYGGVYLGKY
jgi:flavin reductase (DIM6/NTAB) family NADH-FMN oxidoreductase RutF